MKVFSFLIQILSLVVGAAASFDGFAAAFADTIRASTTEQAAFFRMFLRDGALFWLWAPCLLVLVACLGLYHVLNLRVLNRQAARRRHVGGLTFEKP